MIVTATSLRGAHTRSVDCAPRLTCVTERRRAGDSCCSTSSLVAAGTLRVGDAVFAVASESPHRRSSESDSAAREGLHEARAQLGSGVSQSELPSLQRRGSGSKGATAQQLRRVLVTSVESILRQGVYNVHTLSGTVIVNDVSASHFTSSSSWRSSTAKRLALLWYGVLDIVSLVREFVAGSAGAAVRH